MITERISSIPVEEFKIIQANPENIGMLFYVVGADPVDIKDIQWNFYKDDAYEEKVEELWMDKL